ncbi:MAG: YbjN domain-containing protein [Chloroherpetonaceae bacterium]|nr:YbjN domain-containing protein [Chloroherpetonaceae bacterium]MCS7212104.1 YbjN domain-containing protein [Chloroherpetonaceae bacterium]MDW8020042.1 YbjN domain-containing protein [Chloroherpetonaceae bacterium]MDW8466354.1 YbjN domain-containing protein [Chloroherpetonaceae bacterium]
MRNPFDATDVENRFQAVKNMLLDMDLKIVSEDEKNEILVVEDEEYGIKNMVIDCEDTLLVIEQVIMPVPKNPGDLFEKLLKMNRTLVHGAFVLDEEGKTVIFRDTLQLENLDPNELYASIEALSLALAEHGTELLRYAKS